ncbi:glycosyltransferase [Cecembia rubra]|uniref:glycosyltransferase n=1 Tax=Cecembia rubra TaxID=1485585 RepID=UPI002714D18D|nr:glycosyltransferase [Cecembia rubra]
MVTLYLLFPILYAGMLKYLKYVWLQSSHPDTELLSVKSVTLLVPFRNEAKNLDAIFHSILHLDHRPFQVIFIDDHSTDDGRAILEEIERKNHDLDLQILILPSKGEGKKAAIETGINQASGELIFTTDADCILPKGWIEGYLQVFSSEQIQFVAGPVISMEKQNFLQRFQQIEWASILTVTQMGFFIKKPIMCSAANMAYRKSAFISVNGYQENLHHLSGDDEFLLKKFVQRFGEDSCVYNQNNRVLTQAEKNWEMLLRQRTRWASKWRLHKGDITHLGISLIPFLIQLLFLSSLGFLLQGGLGLVLFLYIWAIKIAFERETLGTVLKHFHISHPFPVFLYSSLLHPIYVVVVGFKAMFGKFEWKGRKSS